MRILLFPPNPSPHLFARQRNTDCFPILLHNNTHNPKLSAVEGIWVYNSHPEHTQKLHVYPELYTNSKFAIKVEPQAHKISFAAKHSTTMTLGQEKGTKWLLGVKQQTGWWLGRSSVFNHWSHPLPGRKWPKEVLRSVSSSSTRASKQHRNSRIKCALLWFLHHRHAQIPTTSSLKRFCSSKQVSCTRSGQLP